MRINHGVSPPPAEGQPVIWRESFLVQAQKDLKLWLCLVLFFGLFRLILFVIFRRNLDATTGAWNILKAVVGGLRFDASISAYWVLPSLLLSLACGPWPLERWANGMRRATVYLFLPLSLSLCIVNVGFFAEYKDNFNQWIYGLLYDDRSAILNTIWQDYHVIPCLLLLVTGGTAGCWLLIRIIRTPFVYSDRIVLASRTRQVMTAFLICAAWFCVARGSLGSAPVKYYTAFKTTSDDFLNKMVLNPYSALKYAIQRHRLLGKTDGWKTILPNEHLREAAAEVFPAATTNANLDELVKQIAPGHVGPAPRHIFLIVMESYDAWTMLPEYRSLGLTPELSRLATNGIFIPAFVPAGNMTIVTLDTVLTGLPGSGQQQAYQLNSHHPFPTSLAATFKRLGYTTRFIMGGYPSWNRLADFAHDQGFDEVHTGDHMAITGKPRDWEWGVDDEDMFRAAMSYVTDDKPSFNLIVSVSNHTPYNLDVFSLGYPYRVIPPDLAEIYSGKIPMKTFGHLWYADRALGHFVYTMHAAQPQSVFAITGDHWSRNFLNEKPSIYESVSVPLVLYGPEILAGIQPPARMAGSHLDIMPTLVDLSAPAGFAFASFGDNLLDPNREPVGFGQFGVVTPDAIFRSGQPDHAQTLAGEPVPLSPKLANLSRRQKILTALGWWRLVRSGTLPPD